VVILNENLVFWDFLIFFFKKKFKELVIEDLFFKMVKISPQIKDFFCPYPLIGASTKLVFIGFHGDDVGWF